MSQRSISLYAWIKVWPVIVSIMAAVFGYGILNQKVEALEKNEVSDRDGMMRLNDNLLKIMADVSYIRGSLDGTKKTKQ